MVLGDGKTRSDEETLVIPVRDDIGAADDDALKDSSNFLEESTTPSPPPFPATPADHEDALQSNEAKQYLEHAMELRFNQIKYPGQQTGCQATFGLAPYGGICTKGKGCALREKHDPAGRKLLSARPWEDLGWPI